MDGDCDMHSEQFMVILDCIPAAIIFFDGKGRVIYTNGKARSLLHSSSNKTPIYCQRPISKSPLRFKIETLLTEAQVFSDVLCQHKDRHYSADGFTVSGGAMLVLYDVSERVATERALCNKEEKYRLLIENAPTGIVMIQDGICVFANRRFGTMSGYGSDVIGIPFAELVHTGDLPIVNTCFSSGKPEGVPHILRMVTPDDAIVWIECNMSPVNFDDREAILLNIMDISAQKRIEEQLQLSEQQMAEIVAREKRFIEDISHYFFNPLCIAKGYIDLSMRDANPGLRRNLKITRDAVDRVEAVVKHVVMEGSIYE